MRRAAAGVMADLEMEMHHFGRITTDQRGVRGGTVRWPEMRSSRDPATVSETVSENTDSGLKQ